MTKENLEYPDRLCKAMTDIYDKGLTTPSGGNLSMRDKNGNIWITPSGLDKSCYQREDIIKISVADIEKISTSNIEIRKPSADYLKTGNSGSLDKFLYVLSSLIKDKRSESMRRPSIEGIIHLAVLMMRPDIKAIVHAHPAGVLGVSVTREIPKTESFIKYEKRYGKAAMASYACPGSLLLAEKVIEQFKAGFNTIILENHGAFVGSPIGIEDAAGQFEELDKACRQREIDIKYRELRGQAGFEKYRRRGQVGEDSDGNITLTMKTKGVSELLAMEGNLPLDIIPEALMVFKKLPEIKEDRVICKGESFIEAFDKLEVAEFVAEAYLQAKISGKKIYRLTEEESHEIKTRYLKKSATM